MVATVLLACVGEIGNGTGTPTEAPAPTEPAVDSTVVASSGLRRLTTAELALTYRDLLGDTELPVFELQIAEPPSIEDVVKRAVELRDRALFEGGD